MKFVLALKNMRLSLFVVLPFRFSKFTLKTHSHTHTHKYNTSTAKKYSPSLRQSQTHAPFHFISLFFRLDSNTNEPNYFYVYHFTELNQVNIHTYSTQHVHAVTGLSYLRWTFKLMQNKPSNRTEEKTASERDREHVKKEGTCGSKWLHYTWK